MASSRQSATNENVSTYDSAGGKDYSALSTWENATDINLVSATQSEVLEVYKGQHDDYDSFDGATTNSSYFRIVRAASGEGHSGIPKTDGTVAAFLNTTDIPCLVIREHYSQLQDLVVRTLANSSNNRNTVSTQSNADFTKAIGLLVIDSFNSGSGKYLGLYIYINSANCVFANCLAAGCEWDGFQCQGSSMYCYNCSSIDNGEYGFQELGGFMECKNCLADNNTTEDYESGMITMTTCGSSDGTGSASLQNLSFSYVASGSDDWHLASGSDGIGDGTDLSADATFAFDDDINDGVMGAGKAGETRSSWDLGFDEYSSGATTAAPTTVAPTTVAPTTLAPTTVAPTTVAPTTLAPTTLAPTTLTPTTLAPTTVAPTTVAPTTVAPTTVPPTTVAPTTLAPTTLAPTTVLPTTVAPTTVAPTTAAPTTLAPTTLAPTTVAPTTAVPTTVAVTTAASTTAVPTTAAVTTVAPTTVAPSTLAPTTVLPTTFVPTTPIAYVCEHVEYSLIVEEYTALSEIVDEDTLYSLITEEGTLNSNIC